MNDFEIEIAGEVVSEVLEDATIILNLETGFYHQLNKTGTIIWDEIKKSKIKRSHLIGKMSAKFENVNLEKDIDRFIESLISKGVIHKV